jgi:hypothetical protein
MHEGLDIGDACAKWNYITVWDIIYEAFSLGRLRQDLAQHHLGETSKLSIAAEITNSFIQEVNAAPPIEPFDVIAATYRDREFWENLQSQQHS